MSRTLRAAVTIIVTGLAVLYLAWKIDVSEAVDILSDASFGYLLAAWVILIVTTVPMAWRWRELLQAKGISDRLTWITRTYFVSYTAGQVLPTSIGGDAMRVYETSRRHPGRLGLITGTVLLDRALGGVATLVLAAVGFAFALGSYDVGAYLWIEFVLVAATVVGGFALFSQSARRRLAPVGPLLERLRLKRPLLAVYEAMHSYRTEARLLVVLSGVTLVVQAIRILPVWLCGEAVGIDLSVRPYYVFGPILFVVLLFPFTINGIAVREAFFVSFLGNLGVDADRAFAAGFLFFLVTVALAAPGAVVLLWENLARPAAKRPVREADQWKGSGGTGRFPRPPP
jgi:glycosyltransferase 2 family protein